jgi:hypothetical protein
LSDTDLNNLRADFNAKDIKDGSEEEDDNEGGQSEIRDQPGEDLNQYRRQDDMDGSESFYSLNSDARAQALANRKVSGAFSSSGGKQSPLENSGMPGSFPRSGGGAGLNTRLGGGSRRPLWKVGGAMSRDSFCTADEGGTEFDEAF